jgi:6-phosphogluconolactonase
MGPDGHTASLFPGHSALGVTGVAVTGISNAPKPPPERVTLTLPVLNAAKRVIFVVTGADKAPAVAESLSYDTHISPAGMVKPHHG